MNIVNVSVYVKAFSALIKIVYTMIIAYIRGVVIPGLVSSAAVSSKTQILSPLPPSVC